MRRKSSSPLTLSPPNSRKMRSSSERKKCVEPGSPCRPARPRSWSSMRRESWRLVPMTWSPPESWTCSRSGFSTPSNCSTSSSYASRARSASPPSSTPASEPATASASSSFSSAASAASAAPVASVAVSGRVTDAATDAAKAAAASAVSVSASAVGAVGKRPSGGGSSGMEAAAAHACRMYSFAMKPELPPSRMSVPRPAMFVEMVTAPARPA
mmetsp:Transcript_53900/g.159708  ORF Transcript_53900/g.159708 Transcript_53900/m.159708 type:complete len:213 (+) Transcript_53900:60-698(+)